MNERARDPDVDHGVDRPESGGDGDRPPTGHPSRPPLVAMVVVGLVGLVVLVLFLRSAGLSSQSVTASMLDEEETVVGPGAVTIDLGSVTVTGELGAEWIQRERCPGWVQFNSLEGDATTVHVIATTGVPDPATGRLLPVDDHVAWLASEAGIDVADPESTTLLGEPAVRGPLVAASGAPEDALVAACREASGRGGSGIRGPAAGFDQYLVATDAPVEGVGTVVVLGAAWVGGDIDLATSEARDLAASLERGP